MLRVLGQIQLLWGRPYDQVCRTLSVRLHELERFSSVFRGKILKEVILGRGLL